MSGPANASTAMSPNLAVATFGEAAPAASHNTGKAAAR